MRLAPKTVMGQLIAGTVLVQLLVFGAFLGISVRQQFRQSREQDRLRLQQQCAIITALVAEPLGHNDEDMMDHVMHAVPITVSIKGARVTDVNGRVIRNTTDQLPMALTERELALLPQLLRDRKYVLLRSGPQGDEGAQPVIADGLVRGIVWLTRNEDVASTTPMRVLTSLLIYFPFALLGNLLLVWVLSATLARPLRQLRRATQQVRDNPNDLSMFPLPVEGHNEAYTLAASFNGMVSELARQRRGTQDTLQLLDTLLRSAPIGFAFYDRERHCVRSNEQMAKLHKVQLHTSSLRRFRDVRLKAWPAKLSSEVERLVERVFTNAEGVADHELSGSLPGEEASRTWRISAFPVVSSEEVKWVGVIAAEITHDREADEAHWQDGKLAVGRAAFPTAFGKDSPLEAVSSLLQLLSTQPGLDASARNYAVMALQELDRAGASAGPPMPMHELPAAAADIKIGELLQSVRTLQSGRLQSSQCAVRERLEHGALLFGYPADLRQLFTGVLRDAVDAMGQGGRLDLRTKTVRENGRRGVRVTVAGTSKSGGSRENVSLSHFPAAASENTRMAMWASAQILEKHHATMRVRSREAKRAGESSATVFSLFFPWDGVPRGPRIVAAGAAPVAEQVF